MGVSAAHAGGFAIRNQSAYGQGSSFAGIAAGGSLSSMFWNPATLSDVEAIELESGVAAILAHIDVELDPVLLSGFPGSDEGDIAPHAFIPSSYGAYRMNERIVLGVGINGPFGQVTEYEDDSILRAFGIAGNSKAFTFNVNPAISVEMTDWLAVALGLQAQYFDTRLSRQALGPLGVSTLEGDDIGLGFTAGLKLTPMAGTEIGLGYRSSIEHELDGELKTPTVGDVDVRYDGVDVPDIVTLGIRQQITDRFRLMAAAEWSNWSRFNTVTIEGGPAPIALPFEYDDGWYFSAGGEFDVTPRVTARAGIGYEIAPIDDDIRSFRLPDIGGLWLSTGLSYQHSERYSFDFGYSFAAGDPDIRAADAGGPDANGPFSGHSDNVLHVVAATIKVKFQ
jgi:long-chain fatty acid transport protein